VRRITSAWGDIATCDVWRVVVTCYVLRYVLLYCGIRFATVYKTSMSMYVLSGVFFQFALCVELHKCCGDSLPCVNVREDGKRTGANIHNETPMFWSLRFRK
jgi:hypothetical protein